MYAKALYDNIADTPDELNFNAGDVLEIIAKDYDDNEGWWKCSLGTLEGLVPANFLEELDEDYEPVYNLPRKHTGSPEETYDQLPIRNYSVVEEEYDILPNRTFTNQKADEVYDELPNRNVYDMPRGIKLRHPEKFLKKKLSIEDEYDVLPSQKCRADDVYDLPRSCNKTNNNNIELNEGVYNLPRPSIHASQPQSDEDYDLPKPFSKSEILPDDYDELPSKSKLKQFRDNSRSSIASSTASSDSLSLSSLQIDAPPLTIDTDEAMEKLLSLKDRVDSAASRLLDLFTPNWRNFPQHKLEEGSLHLESSRIHRALEEFIDFGRRSLATAALNGCKKSTAFISRKLQPIEEDLKILDEMETKLTNGKWDIQVLVDENKREGIPDDFDSFVMTTRASPDDVAELASYIYTHSQNIFRRKNSSSNSSLSTPSRSLSTPSKPVPLDPRSRPLPVIPNPPICNRPNDSNEPIDHCADDYDYVQFDEVRPTMKHNINLKAPNYNRMSAFKEILSNEVSDPARERLLSFYSQFGQCQNLLQDDMDRFIQVIQEQPPIKFVTLSKQILKRSNELVYLGDATCKVLQSCGQDYAKISDYSNQLQKQSITAAQQVSKAAKSWPIKSDLEEALGTTTSIAEWVRSLKHSIHNAIIAC